MSRTRQALARGSVLAAGTAVVMLATTAVGAASSSAAVSVNQFGQLTYQHNGLDQDNHVEVYSASSSNVVTVRDLNGFALQAGSGCTQVSTHHVDCGVQPTVPQIDLVTLNLGEGDDTASVRTSLRTRVSDYYGNDTYLGALKAQRLSSSPVDQAKTP